MRERCSARWAYYCIDAPKLISWPGEQHWLHPRMPHRAGRRMSVRECTTRGLPGEQGNSTGSRAESGRTLFLHRCETDRQFRRIAKYKACRRAESGLAMSLAAYLVGFVA